MEKLQGRVLALWLQTALRESWSRIQLLIELPGTKAIRWLYLTCAIPYNITYTNCVCASLVTSWLRDSDCQQHYSVVKRSSRVLQSMFCCSPRLPRLQVWSCLSKKTLPDLNMTFSFYVFCDESRQSEWKVLVNVSFFAHLDKRNGGLEEVSEEGLALPLLWEVHWLC